MCIVLLTTQSGKDALTAARTEAVKLVLRKYAGVYAHK